MAVRYLRISVTDRCDLRCTYCTPMRSRGAPRSDLLSYEEVVEVVRVLVELGVQKVRVTGGEPLRRPGISWLFRELARVPGIQDRGLTTNGTALASFVSLLSETGYRVNVHLDTVDPGRYREAMGGGDVEVVRDGVRQAAAAGIPLKINAVVTATTTLEEALALVAFGREVGAAVRFIEAMPVSGLAPDPEVWGVMKALEESLRSRCGLDPLDQDGKARMFRGRAGERVGFITPSHARFCEGCDKLRLSSRGSLRSCLFQPGGVDLRPWLRSGDREGLVEAIAGVIRVKNSERKGACIESMVGIGG